MLRGGDGKRREEQTLYAGDRCWPRRARLGGQGCCVDGEEPDTEVRTGLRTHGGKQLSRREGDLYPQDGPLCGAVSQGGDSQPEQGRPVYLGTHQRPAEG